MLSSYDLDEAAKRCVLADCFHLTHFKAFQTCVIDAVLNKRDSLVIQPTGSGKSLCYQFPAVHTKQMTLVTMPTISLMQDQTSDWKSWVSQPYTLGQLKWIQILKAKHFVLSQTHW